MRFILGITLVLFGIGIWSCQIDGAPPPTAVEAPWIRTADGWERAGYWLASQPAPPRLHPLVVAAGQLLLSLLALAWGSSTSNELASSSTVASGSRAKS